MTVWVYEGSLKVEKEAVTLSEYEVSMRNDHKQVQAVNSARAHVTPFRSPLLTLFELEQGQWLLYWKMPKPPPKCHIRPVEGIIQLPLFDLPPIEMAAGAEEVSGATHPRSHLHPILKQPMWQETEE